MNELMTFALLVMQAGIIAGIGYHVAVIRDDGEKYFTVTEAAAANGVDASCISAVIHGHQKTSNGHTFRKVDE